MFKNSQFKEIINSVGTRKVLPLICDNCGYRYAEHKGSECPSNEDFKEMSNHDNEGFNSGHVDIRSEAWIEQPKPVQNEHPAAWTLVISDMANRDIIGAKKYGTRLQPNNGRDSLRDAYEEALDLAVYLRNAIYERDSK